MYDVHYWPTPNGKKVTILLEELGVDYRVVECNIGKGDQFADEFLRICPNNRMPALVDHDPADGGEPVSVFESGAMMMYLAEKEGRFLPTDLRGRYAVTQWVFWQMANQGPKSGECGHFRRLKGSQGDQSYAVTRFTDEVNRMYGVVNNMGASDRRVQVSADNCGSSRQARRAAKAGCLRKRRNAVDGAASVRPTGRAVGPRRGVALARRGATTPAQPRLATRADSSPETCTRRSEAP